LNVVPEHYLFHRLFWIGNTVTQGSSHRAQGSVFSSMIFALS
jgi:hypothetical protein